MQFNGRENTISCTDSQTHFLGGGESRAVRRLITSIFKLFLMMQLVDLHPKDIWRNYIHLRNVIRQNGLKAIIHIDKNHNSR